MSESDSFIREVTDEAGAITGDFIAGEFDFVVGGIEIEGQTWW